MKILQVQFKNRNGHTLRGIVTLPDTEGKVHNNPRVVKYVCRLLDPEPLLRFCSDGIECRSISEKRRRTRQ